jgi:hypothetical protein
MREPQELAHLSLDELADYAAQANVGSVAHGWVMAEFNRRQLLS